MMTLILIVERVKYYNLIDEGVKILLSFSYKSLEGCDGNCETNQIKFKVFMRWKFFDILMEWLFIRDYLKAFHIYLHYFRRQL